MSFYGTDYPDPYDRGLCGICETNPKTHSLGAMGVCAVCVDRLEGKGITLADPPEDERGNSWVPVDLDPFLDGTYVRPTPSVGLARADGLHLIYAGKEHTVIGEMECGKSWYCAASAAAELTRDNHVIYIHFEEADPADTVERLLALGVPADTLRKQLHFVGPDEPVTPTKMAALLDLAPTLVVLDGVNEAMSMHTMGIRDEDGAAAFRRRLVKPFTTTGAATLAADHVVKDKEKRGRDPLGSIHKGNGLTGTLILLENATPFGRGARGVSHVFVTKDRPGHLRQHGKPDGLPGKTFMGTLVVDDTHKWVPYLDLTFLAPKIPTAEETAAAWAAAMEGPTEEDIQETDVLEAIAKIVESGREVNMRGVYATSGYGKDCTSNTLERLLIRGALVETKGPNRARLFTIPPSVPQDQTSESAEGTS